MKTVKHKAKVLFVITNPRSLSTIFMRVLMNFPKTKVFNDRLCHLEYCINKTECKLKDDQRETNINENESLKKEFLNNLFKEFEDSIYNPDNELVVIKDMARQIIKYFKNEIIDFINKHDIKPLYLIRHPVPQMVSLKKMVIKELSANQYNDDFLITKSKENMYFYLHDCYNSLKGMIIITENLQENPEETFKYVCEYMDIEFKSEFLYFKSLNEIGIPDELNLFPLWYEDCFISTYVKKGVSDLRKSSLVDCNSDELNLIDDGETIYQKFVENSKFNFHSKYD